MIYIILSDDYQVINIIHNKYENGKYVFGPAGTFKDQTHSLREALESMEKKNVRIRNRLPCSSIILDRSDSGHERQVKFF